MGDAKNNPTINRRPDERVKASNPKLHARALNFLQHNNGKLPAK
jgi:hypothetical protein